MVQGINFKNYSVEQLKELKNAGVQISDADIKAAEEREAQAADDKASDEAKVSYKIKDEASETNEAQQEVKTAQENGTNLKGILEKLNEKCTTKHGEMQKLSQEMEKYIVKMEDLSAVAGDIQEEATQKLNRIEVEAQKMQAKIDAKKAEAEVQVKVIEDEEAKGEGADEGKVGKAQDSIESISEDMDSIADEMKALEKQSAAKIKKAAAMKATLLGESMMDVKDKAQAALKDAINANEYADVTIEKGTEASSITDRNKAKEGGWTKSSWIFWRKGDVDAANRAGNVSIALGEQLGGSSQSVVGDVKTVGTQYGFGFESRKGIEEIVKKEYVDTSKLADVKTFDEARQEKGFFGAIKQMKENQDIYNEIAEASKNKNVNKSQNDATLDVEFAKSLPTNKDAKETTLQVGNGSPKIKGFYAKNPETGNIVYADETGRHYTEEAFKNWEKLAKA